MNDAATPNATHMPCRCRLMWRAWLSPAAGSACDREACQEQRAEQASDSTTSAHVQRRARHRRERDRDQVQEAERVERTAGQVEEPEQQHVRPITAASHPAAAAAGAPAARTPGCSRSRRAPAPAAAPPGWRAASRGARADGDELPADRGPAQADQPVEVRADRGRVEALALRGTRGDRDRSVVERRC